MRVIQIEYKNLFSKMPVDELEDNKQIWDTESKTKRRKISLIT